ncbi:GNAT family N-acetyltransferase [Candidatus Sumerlaeota bacterium]|nr:GNAT family N-acetyltransferase [Candidatus Sumerlaeota bacterium]
MSSAETINVRPIIAADHAAIVKLVAELPEWFSERTRNHAIPVDLKHQIGFVAEEAGAILGFITLFVYEARLNIGWMAVAKNCHRRGAGGLLLARAEQTGAS